MAQHGWTSRGDSALAFRETSIKADTTRSMSFRPRRGMSQGRRRTTQHAPPTLQELATRSFLENADHIEATTLLGLPWHNIGAPLWQRIEQSNLTTPTIWAAFVSAFPDVVQLAHYTASDMVPHKTMAEYAGMVTSPLTITSPVSHTGPPQDFTWLTALTLSKLDLTHRDLLTLAQIPNLVALDIQSKDHPGSDIVDDRIMRTWSEHATECTAFGRLQVLILRNQPNLTSRSLDYLSRFPNLALFGMQNCGLTRRDESVAKTKGWTTEDSHGVLEAVDRDIVMTHSAHGILYGCVRRSSCLLDVLGARRVERVERGEGADRGVGIDRVKRSECAEQAKQAEGAESTEQAKETEENNSPTPPTQSKIPPLLSYRIGATSSTTLTSSRLDHSTPLIFYRSLRFDAAEGVGPVSTYASRRLWPEEREEVSAWKDEERGEDGGAKKGCSSLADGGGALDDTMVDEHDRGGGRGSENGSENARSRKRLRAGVRRTVGSSLLDFGLGVEGEREGARSH